MPLARGLYGPTNPEALRNGLQVLRESISRRDLNTDVAAALTTQVMTAVAIPLQAGDIVSKLAFMSGATAAVTPTNYWVALFDTSATPALLAQSADQLTAAWAADTVKDLALSSVITITQSGVYYAALMVKAATVPSLVCSVLPRAAVSTGATGQKILALTSGAALTTTAPATLAAPTAVVNVPYCFAH